jgi:hypothetical protein
MVKNLEILALDDAGTVVEIAHARKRRLAVAASFTLLDLHSAVVLRARSKFHPERTYPWCVIGNAAALTLWGYHPPRHGPHYDRPELMPKGRPL